MARRRRRLRDRLTPEQRRQRDAKVAERKRIREMPKVVEK